VACYRLTFTIIIIIIIIIVSILLSLLAVREFCGQVYELLFVQLKRRLEHLVQQDARVS
jgi:hypothetical protein